MMELLAPAGSPEAVTAAVQSGADAVYFGFGDFNARRNAKNFTPEEAAAAVSYCHLRGARVFLTLNTLLTDRELGKAAEFAAQASEMGFDAVIVQDLGVVRALRQTVPDLPLHGSTQMSVHSLDGVLRARDMGLERVVLARELSGAELEHICLHAPIEVETFVHGALCMSYSGQCYFSSVIGGRSGNRGLCAQPCRMMYGWRDKADGYPLSLKDLSMSGHLKALRRMGISCLKIEGRMKRPEYVSVVTGIYARALREGREPTAEEVQTLSEAFSRQGFTQGYFLDRTGPDMFGVREEERPPKELYDQARAFYQNGENRKSDVTFFASILRGEPAQVAVRDGDERVGMADGPVPEEAVNVPLDREKVAAQLERTGGTPYRCEKVVVRLDEGLSLPLSALNALRREALEALSTQRAALPQRRTTPFQAGVRYENRREAPLLTVSVRAARQATNALFRAKPDLLYLPAAQGAEHPETVELAQRMGVEVAAELPRITWNRERDELVTQLRRLRELGVTQALVGTWDAAELAAQEGFTLRGDYGLGTYNSMAVKELKRLGFLSATASFELKLAQIRDLSKPIDMEMIAYGRLPLMLTQNCIVKNHTGVCNCENSLQLVDRTGARFPVVKAPGCRNEILNSRKLFLADKARDYQKLGLWAVRLAFTTEDALQCVQVLERYQNKNDFAPPEYTRGLYYREVE